MARRARRRRGHRGRDRRSGAALMASIGFVLHHERTQAADLAREAAAWLQDEGHAVRIPRPDADLAGLESLGCDEAVFGDGLDLAVSLGGDGTMLRTVDLVA